MVSEIFDAEDSNLMSCTSCDSFWAECGCKGSDYFEAPGSNYMKPKDAAAILAKNKNKLCSITFTKKNGSTRTLTGRTGVFRARDGSTIVGKEKSLPGMLKHEQRLDSSQCGMQMQHERLEITDQASE